jgi:GT2 family glycosyltransferase
MKFSFIILTWNSKKYIEKCIKSYLVSLSDNGVDAEFLIVDNGSSDETVNIIEQKIIPALSNNFSIRIFKMQKNFGTTRPRNLAIKKAKGDFLIICDSDTQFISGDWKKAYTYLAQHTEVGIIAPHLFYEDGETQNSVKKFPTFLDKLLKLRKIFLKTEESTTDHYDRFLFLCEEPEPVDTAISAFWILRQETLDEIGLFDEHIFYAPEDLDYCLRVWKRGKKIIFYPEMQIMHKTQRISHVNPLSKIAFLHFVGLLYYYLKHRYFFSRENIYKRIKRFE